ncbi:MAG: 16S rRNA (cytosine(1402)-N(4))-methyltransferase RsmH [Candidatus Peribacteraceae bacterium]|nr:16S rRNA (cytosine(1402)-N(4))-methyltransferase RsmH [Candidatus Peribacteraceae bacterium]
MVSGLTHTPVLLQSVLDVLAPRKGETILDVTLGLGGHAREFLRHVGSTGQLIGLDADTENLALAGKVLGEHPNVTLIHANFSTLPSLSLPKADVLFADLGLSSPHIDDPARGFTFREEVPLDLRYDRMQGRTAAAWLAQASAEDVARVFREFGELPSAMRFARILKERLPTTTTAIVLAAESVYHWQARAMLPQIFQALRIAVNDEMGALDILLSAGPSLLKPGGRMGIISYHSLEDRRVKQTFRTLVTPEKDDRTGAVQTPAPFALLTRKAVTPSADEIRTNPRARSAKFRALLRIDS